MVPPNSPWPGYFVSPTVSELFFHSSSPFFHSNCRAPDRANSHALVRRGGSVRVEHGETNRFTPNKSTAGPWVLPPTSVFRGVERSHLHPAQHPAGRTKPLKDRT